MKMLKRLGMGLLAIGLMMALTVLPACQSVRLIDPNMTTQRVLKGPFVAPSDGYFVPDARMHQILDLLSEKDIGAK